MRSSKVDESKRVAELSPEERLSYYRARIAQLERQGELDSRKHELRIQYMKEKTLLATFILMVILILDIFPASYSADLHPYLVFGVMLAAIIPADWTASRIIAARTRARLGLAPKRLYKNLTDAELYLVAERELEREEAFPDKNADLRPR